MATTTIISSVTAGGSYPTDVSISASNGCGSLCFIPTAEITEQMTYELPAISVDVIMPDDSIYTNIQIVLNNIQGTNPYIIPLYELPSSCSLRVMPLFDKYALSAHNENIECGFDGTVWDTPTTTFPISVVFDDTDISSEGGSGGGGGGTGVVIKHGEAEPTSSIGSSGDVYLQTSSSQDGSVSFINPQRVQVDYLMNENSTIVFDCELPAPSNSYDTPFGSRDGGDYFIAYNGGTLRYAFGSVTGNIGSIANYYNDRLIITMSKTNFKVECVGNTLYDVAISGGSTASTVNLGFFSLFTDNSGGDNNMTRCSGKLHECKIYESGTLVRDYIGFKDSQDVWCVKDTLSDNLFYPINGPITGEEIPEGTVKASFVKVGSTWQSLIGSNISDVNTGS